MAESLEGLDGGFYVLGGVDFGRVFFFSGGADFFFGKNNYVQSLLGQHHLHLIRVPRGTGPDFFWFVTGKDPVMTGKHAQMTGKSSYPFGVFLSPYPRVHSFWVGWRNSHRRCRPACRKIRGQMSKGHHSVPKSKARKGVAAHRGFSGDLFVTAKDPFMTKWRGFPSSGGKARHLELCFPVIISRIFSRHKQKKIRSSPSGQQREYYGTHGVQFKVIHTVLYWQKK